MPISCSVKCRYRFATTANEMMRWVIVVMRVVVMVLIVMLSVHGLDDGGGGD